MCRTRRAEVLGVDRRMGRSDQARVGAARQDGDEIGPEAVIGRIGIRQSAAEALAAESSCRLTAYCVPVWTDEGGLNSA